MRRVDLEIEHRYKNKFVAKHLLVHGRGMKVVGSSRDADIRLLGEDIDGIHASIESIEGQKWMLTDMGSRNGTWVEKNPIVEHVLEGETTVSVGGHHLRLILREIDSDLFTPERGEKAHKSEGKLEYHQIVIRKKGLVLGSNLLPHDKNFEFIHSGEVHSFNTPKDFDVWEFSILGDFEIRHRRVRSEVIVEESTGRFGYLLSPEFRGPMIVVSFIFLALISLFIFMPEKPSNEMNQLKPDENKYTSIIYDAKKLKKQKEAASVMKKSLEGQAHVQEQKPKATGVQNVAAAPKGQGAKVVNSIKAAGLDALIGKISKRAAKNAESIVGSGVAPDQGRSGRATGVAGSTLAGETAKTGGGGTGHKIGGVATDGVAGGSNSYKGVGGLSLGNVGNATVGVLEEETEVEGGLDKEIIARVIQSNLGQIRYCYERQLSASPDLYGKIAVRFTIGAAGSVVTQSIGTTSLKNAMVEGCILRRIAGWKFPTPKGGTQVIVSYPFLFKSTQ